ncbi:MAG TPA: aldehyde dehydrogenase family protein, partial [Bryobacteraceae bacterium]|nr:aldehyde dehydrogenase family protein [Bryobacteraceae bacterium]
MITIRLPWDGSVSGTVDTSDAGRAIAEAERGSVAMARLVNHERADLLARLVGLLRRDAERYARTVASESGKPIREAQTEVQRAIQTALLSSEEARRLAGEVVPMDATPAGCGRLAMTVREPVGIVAAITPFNFPLNLAMHKIAPALAAGNAVVHKPASATPLSAMLLQDSLKEAGAPEGAYNVVVGEGGAVGLQIVADPRVALVTFTGSVEVGKRIREAAGLKRVILELGSNSAVVVEPDADLDWAVPRSVTGAYSHSGQVCISVQRIYAHEEVAHQFLEAFCHAAVRLKIGHPLHEDTDVSSLISEAEADRVVNWIDNAVKAGATLIHGGKRVGRATVEPAVLADVPAECELSCNEAFGPVAFVNTYRHLDEAIALVNDSRYGLQAGIFTRNLQRAFQAAREIRTGGVIIDDVPAFRAAQM